MAGTSQGMDVKTCGKVEEPHPCDSTVPCDLYKEDEGDCPTPFLCLEKLKNPAIPGEITKCLSGNYISVKSCVKVDPPHPCDPPSPCNENKSKTKKKPCKEPSLCLHRIKNPDIKKKVDQCEPDI